MTVATWRQASNAIKATLTGVSSVGTVWDYPHDLTEEFDYQDLATSWDSDTNKPIINVWILERGGVGDRRGGQDPRVCLTRAVRDDNFRINGYYGFAKNGETYFEFQDIVEAVMDELLDNVSLGLSGTVAGGARAGDIDFRRFGPYLCHWVEIRVPVTRRLQPTFS